MFRPITRRQALTTLAACIAVPRFARAAPPRELTLWGPPATPSVTLAHAAASGRLAPLAEQVAFRVWRNPDEMRAGLTSGTMQVVVMPTTTAANLYTRGLGVRLVNVMTDGLLYVVAADPSLTGFDRLKGRSLAVPFRNDTPEFVMKRLLRHHGLTPGADLRVDSTGTPIEAIQLLLAGRIDAALVPEPAASAAIMRAAAAGKTVARVIDVQQAWAEVAGPGATLPQAGLAVSSAFHARQPDLVGRLHEALAAATVAVRAEPARAASDAAAAFELPAAVLERSIPHSNLVATRAITARPALETLFRTVADADPAIIGGRLPDAGFYL